MKKIESDNAFVASLNPAQRAYFLQRTADQQRQLQETLRDLGRAVSLVSSLGSDAQAIALTHGDGSSAVDSKVRQ